jgi:hypothetical protein
LGIVVSAWMMKAQQELIDYVITENQVLKEKLGGKRISRNDVQRRRLSNRIIEPGECGQVSGPVHCRERLGGTGKRNPCRRSVNGLAARGDFSVHKVRLIYIHPAMQRYALFLDIGRYLRYD